MTAMRPPTVRAAFGQVPLAASPTWTDLSTRLRRATVSRRIGEAGQVVAVLDNRDRALEAEYAGSAYYPNVKPNLRLRLDYTEGNLLDADSASAEGGSGSAVAIGGSLSRTQAQALDGSWSFLLTGGGGFTQYLAVGETGAGNFDSTRAAPVVAGRSYTAIASLRAATTARPVEVWLRYWTSAGAFISNSISSSTNNSTTAWTARSVTAVAPANAAYATIRAAVVNANESHYVDQVGILDGTTTWAPGWTPVADAYVDSLPPSYAYGANGGDAVVTASCTDLTKFLARYPVRVPYDVEVAADAPRHWWPLGEAANSTTAGDRGSVPTTGTYTSAALLAQDPVVKATNQTSIKAGIAIGARWKIPEPPSSHWTVEVVIDGIEDRDLSITALEAVTIGPVAVRILLSDDYRPTLAVEIKNQGLPVSGVGYYSLDAGPHVVTVVRASGSFSVWLNGVFQESIVEGSFDPLTAVSVGHPYTAAIDHTDITARVANISIYGTNLAGARILAHAQAARTPWQGDSTGGRVTRLLNQVGVPAASQSVNTGSTTNLAPVLAPVEGKYVLDLIRKTDETEMGWTFVTAAGAWRFIGRRDLRAVASTATFGDSTGEVPYADLVPDYSEVDLIRIATVTREGGNPQTYTDPGAVTGDAVFDGSRDGLLYGTDGEAADAATWLVTEHRDPHLSFRRMVLTGERSSDVMRTIARTDLGHKVTVRRRPPGGGAALERTVVVVGITHDIDCQARTWHTTYELGSIDTSDYWILEDALFGQLDSTTVLAF